MFGHRTDISIFFISNREIVRADFELNAKKPHLLVRESLDVESSLPESLQLVLESQPRPGRNSFVVSTNIWSQVILLPRLSVNGIEQDELFEALKFEAETLSGIEIDDVMIDAKSLSVIDDQQAYWVIAQRESETEAANRILEQAGCRHVEFSHPAGMGLVDSKNPEPQVEVWFNVAFLFFEPNAGLTQIRPVSSFLESYQSGTLTIGSDVPMRVLKGPESPALELDGAPLTSDLAESNHLEVWLSKIARRDSDLARNPSIRISKRQTVTSGRHFVSGALAVLVLAFCVWHSNYENQRIVNMSSQIENLKQPALEKKKYDSRLLDVFRNRSDIESEDAAVGEDLKTVQFFLEHQKDRFSELLGLIVELRTPELVLTNIGGTAEGVTISGISLNPEASQAFAKKLRVKTASMGWIVNPATQIGLEKMTSGGPWNYEILLTDTGPFDRVPVQNRGTQISKTRVQDF